MDRSEATETARQLVDDAVMAAQRAAPELVFEKLDDAVKECLGTLGEQTEQVSLVIDQTAVVDEATPLSEVMSGVEAVWSDAGVEIDRKEATAVAPGPSMFGQLDDFNLEAGYIAETSSRPLSILIGVSTPCVDP